VIIGKTITVSFLFSGQGLFCAKDILLPNGIQCINLELNLVTLSPGRILRGYVLIQKTRALSSVTSHRNIIRFGEPRTFTTEEFSREIIQSSGPIIKNFQKSLFSPWLSLGFPDTTVKRVGFRIEPIGPINNQAEVLIFELNTNGRISPRQAVREAALLLVDKFLDIAKLTQQLSNPIHHLKHKQQIIYRKSFSIIQQKFDEKVSFRILKTNAYSICNTSLSRFREPLILDLGNLDLNQESYQELKNLGFETLGQLLERITFESTLFSPVLRRQRQKALFRFGLFPFLFLYNDFSISYKICRSA
jgi:DNA-directed RNA polymerase alpha subunit